MVAVTAAPGHAILSSLGDGSLWRYNNGIGLVERDREGRLPGVPRLTPRPRVVPSRAGRRCRRSRPRSTVVRPCTAPAAVARAAADLLVPLVCAGCDAPGPLALPGLRCAAGRPRPSGRAGAGARRAARGGRASPRTTARSATCSSRTRSGGCCGWPARWAPPSPLPYGRCRPRAVGRGPASWFRSRRRRRRYGCAGHDPTARIAGGRGRRPGRRGPRRPGLRQGRAVADQAGLGAAARAANLSGALVAGPAAGSRSARPSSSWTTSSPPVPRRPRLPARCASAGCVVLGVGGGRRDPPTLSRRPAGAGLASEPCLSRASRPRS